MAITMRELPPGWEAAKLSAVIELNPKTTDLADDTLVGFVPMAMLGKSYLDTLAFHPRRWAEVKRGYTHFRDGDVLLAKITPCFENGKAGVVRGLPNGVGAGSTEYFVCRPRADAVEARYLLAFVKSSSFVSEGAARMTGSVGHKRVPKEYVSEQRLPLAPRGEQTRIADQLDTLLARINACNDHFDAIPGILKRFRQAVLNSAIRGDLLAAARPHTGSRVTAIPIVDVCLKKRHAFGIGPFGSNLKVNDYRSSGVPLIFVRDIRARNFGVIGTKFVSYEKARQLAAHVVLPGDLLLTKMGDPPGDTAIYPDDRPPGVMTADVVRMRVNPAIAHARYISYWFESAEGRHLVEGITAGVAQRKISLDRLKTIRIELPDLEEQSLIVQRVESMLQLADQFELRLDALRARAQRLVPQVLAKAFRGELVEQDPQDEPASVLLQRLAASQPIKAPVSRGRPRAQPKAQPSTPDRQIADWTSLPGGAWAAPADPEGHATAVWLTAVLRAWSAPMPERTARLAALLCQQPHLFISALPAAQARLWSRLVGDAAKPLPAQMVHLQPAVNHFWGRALQGMRMRGDLVEAGTGDDVTWALGPGAAAIATAGWPDGRAGFVVAHLRAHGLASILSALAPAEQAFVDARAA